MIDFTEFHFQKIDFQIMIEIAMILTITIQNEIQSDIGNYIKITMTLNLKF